jgi:hypothetical protein
MLGIMKKDAPTHLLMACLALGGPTLDAALHGLRGNSVVTTGSWTLMLLLPVVQCEIAERLMRGYRFLQTLPLTAREIVWAKHLWPLVLVALQKIYVGLLFTAVAPEKAVSGQAYSVLIGDLTILVAALLLFIIFKFGLSRAGMVALIFVNVAAIIGLQELVIRRNLSESIGRFGSGPALIAVTALCLAAYALMAEASARAFERRED